MYPMENSNSVCSRSDEVCQLPQHLRWPSLLAVVSLPLKLEPTAPDSARDKEWTYDEFVVPIYPGSVCVSFRLSRRTNPDCLRLRGRPCHRCHEVELGSCLALVSDAVGKMQTLKTSTLVGFAADATSQLVSQMVGWQITECLILCSTLWRCGLAVSVHITTFLLLASTPSPPSLSQLRILQR